MSLRDLEYVNVPRKNEVINRSLPDPPYELRSTTMKKDVANNSWSITPPSRRPWHFTNFLAMPSLVNKIEAYRTGVSQHYVDEGNEGDDEDEVGADWEGRPKPMDTDPEVLEQASGKSSSRGANRRRGRARGKDRGARGQQVATKEQQAEDHGEESDHGPGGRQRRGQGSGRRVVGRPVGRRSRGNAAVGSTTRRGGHTRGRGTVPTRGVNPAPVPASVRVSPSHEGSVRRSKRRRIIRSFDT